MEETSQASSRAPRKWQVDRILEPKDPLIPKGMRTSAKILRKAGFLLAIAEATGDEEQAAPLRAFVMVSKKNRNEIQDILYEMTPEQANEILQKENE